MALNIKDAETDRLARQLAELMGESITVAVRNAVELQLAALRRRKRVADEPGLADIIARGRARRTRDQRDEDDILGYGDDGMPG